VKKAASLAAGVVGVGVGTVGGTVGVAVGSPGAGVAVGPLLGGELDPGG